jgi:hypothetical protein
LTGSLGYNAFKLTKIDKVLSLGNISTIDGGYNTTHGAFNSCTRLTIAILPSSINNIGAYTFKQCDVLETVVCLAMTPPTLGASAFANTPIASGTGYIYVPDGTTTDAEGHTITIVEAYKAATNWSTYAARIFPISQLETDNPELYAEIEEYL